MRDPAGVAGFKTAQDVGLGRRRGLAEQARDRLGRGDEPVAVRRRDLVQHGDDAFLRSTIERGEGIPTLGRQRNDGAARIVLSGGAADEALVLELLEHPAEVSGIEPELANEVAGGRLGPVGQLVKHARFGEREGARQHALGEQAELTRVEAVEAPYGGDIVLRRARGRGFCELGHGAPPPMTVNQLLDLVK